MHDQFLHKHKGGICYTCTLHKLGCKNVLFSTYDHSREIQFCYIRDGVEMYSFVHKRCIVLYIRDEEEMYNFVHKRCGRDVIEMYNFVHKRCGSDVQFCT